MIALIAVMALGGLTAVLTTILLVAGRKLYVSEDARLDVLEALLPGNNCGACGRPGCRAFAEALVQGDAQPAQCTVSNAEGHRKLADVLGVAVGTVDKVVARLACAGGANVARWRAEYVGVKTCQAASLVAGGGKECVWGCLGFGDCAAVCDFDAIHLDRHDLPVVNEAACTACGDCVQACPKDLFSLQAAADRLWVRCRNEELGDVILDGCEVACTGCGRCAMDAPAVVSMQGNLPRVDYTALRGGRARELGEAAIARCPTGAIVWIDEEQGDIKGADSVRVLRHTPRPRTVS